MGAFLAASVMSALVWGTSQVAGSEQPPPKREVQSVAVSQTRLSDRAPTRKVGGKRQFSATSDLRAEDLIPDICKGCSSSADVAGRIKRDINRTIARTTPRDGRLQSQYPESRLLAFSSRRPSNFLEANSASFDHPNRRAL